MTAPAQATEARTTPPELSLDDRVRAGQAEMTFDRSRSSNLVRMPVALLVTWLLWPSVGHGLLLAWLGGKVVVTMARILIDRRFAQERDQPLRVLHWSRWLLAMLVADGVLYGVLGTWMLPVGNTPLAVAVMATLLGAAATSLVVLSVNLQAALCITVPTLAPPMVWQLMQGTRLSLFMGLGLAIFLLLAVMEGRRSSDHTRAMLRLRFQMDELDAQRQQALAEAQRSNAVKSQFLATMSHEVRTPLHGILGLARLLRDGLPPTESAVRRQHLQTLERTGEHLLNVINDVLDYSKIESHHLRLQTKAIDLHALVAGAADWCRPATQEKGLLLQVEQALPQPCWVQADPARLRQVLLNLLGNAIKFTAQGDVTLHSGRTPDGRFELTVSDTGPGVPLADRERVFNPFEQLDGSFSRQHGGTGLGLSISRELVRAMAGELTCEAAPEGGARFRIDVALPEALSPAADATSPAAAALPSDSAGRVLLVEDNPVNAIVAEAWLRRQGVEVTTVTDGLQAVERATAETFDLILMDCQMPGLDGFEATARIREHESRHGLRARPIVALTANALQGDRERSLAAGMDEHLAKPFNEAELRAVLLRHLPARQTEPAVQL